MTLVLVLASKKSCENNFELLYVRLADYIFLDELLFIHAKEIIFLLLKGAFSSRVDLRRLIKEVAGWQIKVF